MNKFTKRRSASPVSASPRTSSGYGEHRIPQSYLQFLTGQVGEKSERFTLPSWHSSSCVGCHYSGACIHNPHEQFTHVSRRALR